jgi:hypothetical protein
MDHVQKRHVTWQLPTFAVTSLHLRGSMFTEPLIYCCVLDRVYGAVAWQCVDQISYNIVLCSGYLISCDHQLYRVTPLKTPSGLLLLLFQSQSHVTTITHNYFLRCYTCTQLAIIYTFVTTITCSTLTRLHSVRALISNLYCTIAHKVS